jgi:amino acid transporter
MADYLLEALRMVSVLGEASDEEASESLRLIIASTGLFGFWAIHSAGVRWFGRVQLVMCVLLGVSIVVLVVPGLFALDVENLTPMFAGEDPLLGFLEALPILFFAYAGFEAIAHSAAEVKDAQRELPRIYLRGVLLTAFIFVSMSLVAVGVLSRAEVLASEAQMADAAQKFLPGIAAIVVTLGGVMATATSVNATMGVPARLAITLGEERRLPAALASVHAGTGTPILGLTVSLVISTALLWSGQVAFALNIAVLALLCVYLLHSIAFLCLGRRNPEVASQVALGVSPALQRASAWFAALCMGALVTTMVVKDVGTVGGTNLSDRISKGELTAIELFVPWTVLGLALFWISTASDRRTDS